MADSKGNAFRILKILQEYSDRDHILTTKRITDLMDSLYECKVDRRTIYAAVGVLKEHGYEISDYDDNGVGYYLGRNVFSQEEIRLLIDAVFNCEYISARQTSGLLDKLRSFLSEHERKQYNYSKVIKTENKTQNLQVFYNIANLNQAISSGRKIAFTYLEYDYDKKLKPRRDVKDIGCPYAMTCDSGHYYVAATTERHENLVYYRVDMMKDIEVLSDHVEKSKRDMGMDSGKKVVYAFAGKPVPIKLKCKRPALRYVIERFGNDVIITPIDENHFYADFSAAPGGVRLWALQNLENAEVVSPADLRSSIIEALKTSAYLKEE